MTDEEGYQNWGEDELDRPSEKCVDTLFKLDFKLNNSNCKVGNFFTCERKLR